MTRYKIFRQDHADELGDAWVDTGTELEAPSARSAVRMYLNANEPDGGTYVAVSARSWRPMSFEVQTVSRLRLVVGGDAAPPATDKDAS